MAAQDEPKSRERASGPGIASAAVRQPEGDSVPHIVDFCDMDKFEKIMKDWATATGLATVAVGDDGTYISGCYNFTEFCHGLTRKSRRAATLH